MHLGSTVKSIVPVKYDVAIHMIEEAVDLANGKMVALPPLRLGSAAKKAGKRS